MHVSGPLPVASEFARYESALPGAGDRILTMAELNQEAQIKALDRESTASRAGFLISTTALSVFPYAALGATVWLAQSGHEALAWLAGALTALAGGPQVVITIRDVLNRGGDDREHRHRDHEAG